jgi:hypothetical protein
MPILLASNLLFDTDQDNLFGVDEIPCGSLWISARVYKSVKKGSVKYEVWFCEWDPEINEEKPRFAEEFPVLEDAKAYAIQLSKSKNLSK